MDVAGLHNPKLELVIPPGTSSHQILKIPGEGIRRGSIYGDHFFEIGINVDVCSEDDEKTLLKFVSKVDDSECVVHPRIQERKF